MPARVLQGQRRASPESVAASIGKVDAGRLAYLGPHAVKDSVLCSGSQNATSVDQVIALEVPESAQSE